MTKTPVAPESLRSLTPSQQVQKTTLLFFEKAAETPAFIHGKPTSGFFAVRSFFSKQTLESLHLIFDYLWELKEKQTMTMSECFDNARKYQERLRWDSGETTKVSYEDYKDLLKNM